jgi:hypothetical protein
VTEEEGAEVVVDAEAVPSPVAEGAAAEAEAEAGAEAEGSTGSSPFSVESGAIGRCTL